jgi:DNA-binding transcriptional LysR family regulator
MRDTFLHSIEAFTQVVEQQSISGAARRLGLTQPTVSLQIRVLEKRLGVRLVDRIGRRLVPTPAGEAFLKHAQTITGAVVTALEDMSQHNAADPRPDAEGGERLRLGIDPSAGFLLPPAFWRELRQRLPELEVKVHSWPTAQIAEGLENDSIDLGIVILPLSRQSFDVISILADELVFVASSNDTRLPPKLTPAALAELPFLLYEPGGEMRRLLQAWFARAGFHPLMQIGDMEVIKRLVLAGLGYSILPRMALSREEREHLTLRRLTPRLYRKLALIVKKGDHARTQSVQEAITLFYPLATTLLPQPRAFHCDLPQLD